MRIRLDSGDPGARINRALAHIHKGEPEKAIPDLNVAIQLDPTIWLGWSTRCYAEGILGQLPAAIADCDRAVQLEPNEPSPFANRGAAYLRSQNYARALADYDAAIKLFATKKREHASESWYGRGIAYSRLGKRDLAERDFRQAAALDPGIEAKMSKIGLAR